MRLWAEPHKMNRQHTVLVLYIVSGTISCCFCKVNCNIWFKLPTSKPAYVKYFFGANPLTSLKKTAWLLSWTCNRSICQEWVMRQKTQRKTFGTSKGMSELRRLGFMGKFGSTGIRWWLNSVLVCPSHAGRNCVAVELKRLNHMVYLIKN